MDTLLRVGGGAAILAGVLRAAGSFASGGGEVERQSLYFIVDLLLLLGAFAAYAQNHEALGRFGAAGSLTTVAGILLVRSSRAVPGLDLYPAGALLVAVGWVLLSLAWWRRANGPAFVPVLFGLSIVTGLLGQIVPGAPLFIASGAIFGGAIVGAGRQILLTATAAPRSEPSRVAPSQPAERWQRRATDSLLAPTPQAPAMGFARIVFITAGVWGIVVLTPLYFLRDVTGRPYAPPTAYPQFFYGFLSVAMAWQIAFLVIGSNPVRLRLLMIPAIVEKVGHVVTVTVLYGQARISAADAMAAGPDLLLGVLFIAALTKTPKSHHGARVARSVDSGLP